MSEQVRILAQVFVDRIVWFMGAGSRRLGHGVVTNFAELRGVQVRAGIAECVLCGPAFAAEIEAAAVCHDGWRQATAQEAAALDIFFAEASREIEKREVGRRMEGV